MSLALSCAVLGAVIAPVSLLWAAVLAGGLSTQVALNAVVAGVICWFAAALGLVATYLGNVLQSPVQGVLGGMLFRMFPPLAAVIGLPKLGGAFASPGLTTTLLGVYLVALLVETVLALRMVPKALPKSSHPKQQSAAATGA